jgi:uroporphyrinogen decarboxylase
MESQTMTLTREQRVLRTIGRETVDYLPSHIYFAAEETKRKVQEALGFSSAAEFDEYLDSHLQYGFALDDTIFRYRQDPDKLRWVESLGFCRIDEQEGVVYDRWGIGLDMRSPGYCVRHHPLRGKGEEGLRSYRVPDVTHPSIMIEAQDAVRRCRGEALVLCPGYNGIFERAWQLTGFEEFMTGLSLYPDLIDKLLDDITEFKVETARQVVAAGFKCGHTGDDFGAQSGLLMSPATWRRFFRPRLQRVWDVYKQAGLPVIHHSCGNVISLIPDMIEMGLDMLEPIQPVMDLDGLKREFGRHLSFWGGIDTQRILPYGTPDEVRRHTTEVIDTLGAGGGLLIAPSQEIMSDVPVENIVALVETVVRQRSKM